MSEQFAFSAAEKELLWEDNIPVRCLVDNPPSCCAFQGIGEDLKRDTVIDSQGIAVDKSGIIRLIIMDQFSMYQLFNMEKDIIYFELINPEQLMTHKNSFIREFAKYLINQKS